MGFSVASPKKHTCAKKGRYLRRTPVLPVPSGPDTCAKGYLLAAHPSSSRDSAGGGIPDRSPRGPAKHMKAAVGPEGPTGCFRYLTSYKQACPLPDTKNSRSRCDQLPSLFAEDEGFEPPDPCGSTVFKTAAIDHSANPPICRAREGPVCQAPTGPKS